jgi:hypothetical protein
VCMIFIVHTISRNQQPLKMGSPDAYGSSVLVAAMALA